MYNAKKPSPEDLPSAAQLLRSTIIALVAAIVILVTIVLPAEYGIDPTRIGRALGLAEMGEIKQQLAEEAEADRKLEGHGGDQSSLFDNILGLIVSQAHAQSADGEWKDEISFTLEPGQSAEWKLVMEEGSTAEYRMTVEGGRVNFDLHGHGAGQSVTYDKARGSTGSEGTITAAFPGEHGWFWRNRDSQPVTVTLHLLGDYSELKDAS
jgi:hypothetical protein